MVAVDPGRNPILTAVIHDQAAMDTMQKESPDNVKHNVIIWGGRGSMKKQVTITEVM